MNWLRRLFGMHVHQWGEVEILTIPGRVYVNGHVTMNVLERNMRIRWCACGKYKHVY